MKTQIWPDQVRFGKVQQVGKDLVSIEPEDGREGQSYRLYFSHLRSAAAAHGGIVFATGQKRAVHVGDKVAFVPRKDNLWLWALRDEYDSAVGIANSQTTSAFSERSRQEEVKATLTPEEERLLGQRQMANFHRRFLPSQSVV